MPSPFGEGPIGPPHFIAASKMNNDLERVADLATNIAQDTNYTVGGAIIPILSS